MTTKSLFKKFTAILSFVLLLQFISPTAAQAAGTATLSGHVYASNSTSTPLANVQIYGGGAWATTSLDGSYTLTGLTPGAVALWFTPSNVGARYFSKNESVTLADGANTSNFTLKAYPVGTQSLFGTIIDDTGSPIPNVNISISTGAWPENANYSATSSSDVGSEGEFNFSNLPAGKYSVFLSTPMTQDPDGQGWVTSHYFRYLTITLPLSSSQVEWRMIPKSSNLLSGKVVSERDSTVVYPGAWINACVFVIDQTVCESGTTNENGEYSLYLPAGSVKLNANSSNSGDKFYFTNKTFTMGSTSLPYDVLVRPYQLGTLAISGTVLDEAGTTPIANAQVYLYGTSGPEQVSYSVNTDTDGSYRFEKLFKGTYQISSFASDYNSQNSKNVPLTNADKTGIDLNLQLKGSQTISGVVLSPSGNPVGGAVVSAIQKGKYSSSPSDTTDSNGEFTLRQLNGGTDYAVNASAPNYLWSQTTTARAGQQSLTLSLTPYRTGQSTLSGSLQDASGSPLAGQEVRLSIGGYNNSQQEQTYTFTTGQNGQYSFPGLPSGSATISSSPASLTSCKQTVFISGSESKTVDCKFYETTATINVLYTSTTGTVLKSQYSPQLSWTDGPGNNWTDWHAISGIVNEDGSVKFENAPKAQNLRFKSDMWPTSDTEYLTYTEVPQFTLDTRTDPPTKKIVVQSAGVGTSSVTGRVKDVAGRALPGLTLSWSSDSNMYSNESSSMAGSVTTDETGAYTISNLKPGKTLNISFDPGNQTETAYQAISGANYTEIFGTTIPESPLSRVRNLVVKYGDAPINFIDSGSSATGSYTVRLVDTSGNPISGVETNLWGVVGGTSTSDSDGKVTFSDLPVGSYHFSVESNGASSYISNYQDSSVQIAENHLDVVDSDFEMQLAPRTEGSFSGTLVDTSTNQAFSGYECQANLNQLDDQSIHNYWLTSDCSVDSSGVWTVGNLAAGEYTIRFTPAGTNQDLSSPADFVSQFEYPDPIVVHSDGLHLTTLPVSYATSYSKVTNSTIVVSIYDANTRLPISREISCSLSSSSIIGVSNQDVKSDLTGKITLTNLVVGKTYTLRCGGSSQLKLIAQDGLKVAKAYFENVDAGSSLSGRVVDEQGNPVEGVIVGASNSTETIMCLCSGAQDTNRLIQDTTDADGNYYLRNLGGWVSYVGVNDPSGNYGITQVAMTISNNSSGTQNFVLKRGARVNGLITDTSDRNLKVQTTVTLESTGLNAEQYQAWTDYSGASAKYVFDRAVGSGQYRLSVRSWANGSLNYAAGYLQPDGTIGIAKSTARVITIDPEESAAVTLPQIRVSEGGFISGQVSFQSSTGSSLGSEWASGVIDLYYLDGSAWTKSSVVKGGVYSGNNGRFTLDGLLPGTYKLGFNDGAIGLFKPDFANGASSLEAATTFTVVVGQTTSGATGVLRYQPPTNAAQFLTLTSLSDVQRTVLREAVTLVQSGKSVRVKAPEDLVGQYVAASRFVRSASASAIRAARIGTASIEAGVTEWLSVDSEGFVSIPEQYVGTEAQTFVFVNSKNVPVGVADVAGVAAVTPTPPVVTPNPPQLVTQTPGTRVPSTFKPGKKLVLKAKTNMGSAVKVTAKGCKVSPTYKTTISYKTKKVGKRTIRTRVTTKTLISYSVTMGKKGSTCTVTQKSPATTTLAAMTSVTAIKVK